MRMNGYKLSDRAAMAAIGIRPEPREPMKISSTAVARARSRSALAGPSPMAMDAATIYAPAKFPDEIYPSTMAMDSCAAASPAGITPWALGSLFHEGQGFFGYPYLAELQQRAEYRHACDIWAEHAVRKWIKITGGTPEERDAIEAEFLRLNVRDVFQEWMGHDQVFGRGQIFLDFDDADDTAELATPLTLSASKVSPKRPLKRLTVVEPMWSAPGIYSSNNPLRPDFYKPQQWFVYGRQVHTTRMLTIASRPVSDMLKPAYAFGGQSLVQLMKPYVDNWLRSRQSCSDMLNAYSIMVLKTDMSSTMAGGGGDDLFARLDLFNNTRDNRGSMAIDKDNEELENIAVSLSGLSDLLGQSQEQLASVSRIPLSIYLQITPTGLNATNDGETRNFYADVKAYLEKNVRPHLARILNLVQLSLTGAIDPQIGFEFVPLWEMSEADKAEIREKNARTDVMYVDAGIVSNEEARERLANEEGGAYEGVDLTDPAPAPEPDEPVAMDEQRWITVNPHGGEGEGQPVLIEGSAGAGWTIIGGAGGSMNGTTVTPGSMSAPRAGTSGPVAKPHEEKSRLANTLSGAARTEAEHRAAAEAHKAAYEALIAARNEATGTADIDAHWFSALDHRDKLFGHLKDAEKIAKKDKRASFKASESGQSIAQMEKRFATGSAAEIGATLVEKYGLHFANGSNAAREYDAARRQFNKEFSTLSQEDRIDRRFALIEQSRLARKTNSARVRGHVEYDIDDNSAGAKGARRVLGHVTSALDHLDRAGFDVKAALSKANVAYQPGNVGKSLGHAFQLDGIGYFTITAGKNNADHIASEQKAAQQRRDAGKPRWSVSSDQSPEFHRQATTIHELAHALGMQPHINSPAKLRGILETKFPDYGERRAWILNNISEYATTNIHETDAELASLVTSPTYVRGTLPIEFEDHVDALFARRK